MKDSEFTNTDYKEYLTMKQSKDRSGVRAPDRSLGKSGFKMTNTTTASGTKWQNNTATTSISQKRLSTLQAKNSASFGIGTVPSSSKGMTKILCKNKDSVQLFKSIGPQG